MVCALLVYTISLSILFVHRMKLVILNIRCGVITHSVKEARKQGNKNNGGRGAGGGGEGGNIGGLHKK